MTNAKRTIEYMSQAYDHILTIGFNTVTNARMVDLVAHYAPNRWHGSAVAAYNSVYKVSDHQSVAI